MSSANRIERRFARLRAEGRKGLVVYIGAGDPDLEATFQLALALEQAGADILELGVPFSDPLADGLVNQLAAQRGLESGTTPRGVLDTVARIRRRSGIPVVLYLYYNLVHRRGLEAFAGEAARAGVDGLLLLDLPPEEDAGSHKAMTDAGLLPIYLVSPTTPGERIDRIASRAAGFIYCISREGVTGMQESVSEAIGPMARRIRQATGLPIAIGFGISGPRQALQVAAHGDACVVGSAVVDRIARHGRSPDLVPRVASFVRELAQALRQQGHG